MSYYSIDFNWSEELGENLDNWENLGRDILNENCTHKTQDGSKEKDTNLIYSGWCDECDVSIDSCEPIMNYAYKLGGEPTDENILKIVQKTCLTVMRKIDTDETFLVLCGGGMNLSQQIGLAYLFADGYIPKELLREISTQKGLSVNGKEWTFLRNAIIKQLKQETENLKGFLKDWENTKE